MMAKARGSRSRGPFRGNNSLSVVLHITLTEGRSIDLTITVIHPIDSKHVGFVAHSPPAVGSLPAGRNVDKTTKVGWGKPVQIFMAFGISRGIMNQAYRSGWHMTL